MVFSSLYFLFLFLPVTLLSYHLVNNIKAKNIILLIASLLFYAWGEPKYVLLMIAVTAIDWFAGLLLNYFSDDKKAKAVLCVTVALNLLSLIIFKYLNLFTSTLDGFLGITATDISLPIGISFYTFQALSYVVDVYRKNVKCQANPFRLLLYISMFPQLIAGPIVRYSDIAKEIGKRRVSFSDFSYGVGRFITGLAKKVILANFLGEITANYFDGDLSNLTVLGAWAGMFAYFFQIYFDFSGYSDMAIGMGRMLGFHFLENFNYPYMSVSVTDFWRRWHISLSSFFRDYVYIPLGGNRKNQIFNMLVVWLLTGFWHGASWNFLLWGFYYFVALMLEKYVYGKALNKLPKFVGWIYTTLIVIVGWVFFYFDNLGSAGKTLGTMFGIGAAGLSSAADSTFVSNRILLFAIAIIACTPLWSKFLAYVKKIMYTNKGSLITYESVRAVGCVALLVICIACLVGSSYNPFLYFRF